MEQVNYILNFFINLPLFPLLYLQGKKIRKDIPSLPEAKNPKGSIKNGNRSINLIVIGESTMAGVGVQTHQQGFTGHLANKISNILQVNIDWQVMAKSGYTAKSVNDKLLPKINSKKQDLVVIGLGGNDTFKVTSPKKWKKELILIIDKLKLKFPNTPIVFANVPPVRDFPAFTPIIKFVLGRQIDLLHEVLKKVAEQKDNVWYIEERIELKHWIKHFKNKKYTAQDFFSDGVHPSELTYKTWGEEVAKFILKEKIIQ